MKLKLKPLEGRFDTLDAMLAMPGMAEGIRQWAYDSATYDGLSPFDADDAAHELLLKAYALQANARENGMAIDPVRILFSARAYLRRSNWRGFTGQRRSRSRKMPAPMADMASVVNVGSRSGMSDNPAALAMAMETVRGLAMTACGRNAKALRKLSEDDIRGMACPALQGGTPVAIVDDPAPRPMKPLPPMDGDGTAIRPAAGSDRWYARGFALRHWIAADGSEARNMPTVG